MAKVAFTGPKVAEFRCPPDKKQAFLWDSIAPGLGLRSTPAGMPAYVFQSVYQGKTIRLTIGSPTVWQLEDSKRVSPDGRDVVIQGARSKAKAMQRLIDDGKDPRDLKRNALAEKENQATAEAASAAIAAANALTVGDIWPQYLEEGKPKRRKAWKPRYRADIVLMSSPGGIKKKRGEGFTRVGPLFPLMAIPLSQINEDTLKAWHDKEAKQGADYAARALMIFRGFLRWASSKPEYRSLVDRDAGRAPAILDSLPSTKANKRKDCLEAAQLPGWFSGADMLGNKTIATYLKALLLTGSRREEMAALRWDDVDFRWSRLTLADKVFDTRIIPLSPYLAQLIASLPRVTNEDGKSNPYVFAAKSASGHVEEPRSNFAKVNKHAGVIKLTIHGLRRSFSLLGEAAGAPAGAIAQIMGHSPESMAESYRPRSVDALRTYLAQIEAHILAQAGIVFDAKAAPGALRVVQAA